MTQYHVFVAEPNGSCTYVFKIGDDATPLGCWSGSTERAHVFKSRKAAIAYAQRLGDWLASRGYETAARWLQIKPRTGGMCINWRWKPTASAA